jgi:hypothetical protein
MPGGVWTYCREGSQNLTAKHPLAGLVSMREVTELRWAACSSTGHTKGQGVADTMSPRRQGLIIVLLGVRRECRRSCTGTALYFAWRRLSCPTAQTTRPKDGAISSSKQL